MRIDLKGIHAAHVTLASGTEKIYWYAWRGGPRLRGEPGTPDFIASYNEAVAQRATTPAGKLQFLIDNFRRAASSIRFARARGLTYKKYQTHRAGIR